MAAVPTLTDDWLALTEHEGGGGGGALLKVVVTVRGPVIARTHAPVPLQSPPQPLKKEVPPPPGVAVRVIEVPTG